ncbi:hypothetical protein [Niastella populi]|uniref:Outer membrane protein beta-barrel domain-containing protein n=1 Tax=Niastella populi TaxID=550983 RepID=A0A1V9G295_9BACT|nr:hypothetical protein [Niastella populi]OQP64586.1 hypothetical protein A4R26_16185 [Niastella populi]
MRKAALTGLVFVACAFATNAQLSVTPRVGIEQAFTCVKYNNTSRINPMSANFSPQVGLRADYLFNKRHGPFVGLASNRSLVTYEFTNPETGDKEFSSSNGDWKLRLEAGYQVSSKAIALGKHSKAKTAPVKAGNPCAARKMMMAQAAAAKKPVMNMRIQPFVGMAFVPDPQTAITSIMRSNETVYQYSAGNWTSAFMTGVNLAFAKGDVNKYVVGIQYLRGIGNLNNESLTTPLDGKELNTQLSSSASAWNITVGMPLNFTKSKPVAQKAGAPQKPAPAMQKVIVQPKQTPAAAPAEKPKKSCGYYQKRCGRSM